MTYLPIVSLLILVLMLAVARTSRAEEVSETERQARLAGSGMELEPKEAESLEFALKKNPAVLDNHIILLGYYQFKKDADARAAYIAHALWLIQNKPEEPAAGGPFMHFRPDDPGFAEIQAAWDAQVAKYPDNATVLGHAATLHVYTSPEKAEKLLLKAMELDPNNIEWSESLSHAYERKYRNAGEKERQVAAQKALSSYEKTLSLADADEKRFYLLDSLAKAAFAADDMKKARQYALDVLKLAPNFTDDWNYGNAIYFGNAIQGQIALHDGDVKTALQFLLLAGKTKGSPQLNSFGPDFTLAKGLLAKGEKDGVLEFLASCRTFWKMGHARIDTWTAEIKKNGTTDFKQ